MISYGLLKKLIKFTTEKAKLAGKTFRDFIEGDGCLSTEIYRDKNDENKMEIEN